jgi:type I protein arginine methyltransferase
MIHTYSLQGYGQMILDAKRTAGYREALRRTINPGTVVLDIGTGTGIFALMACQFGAARVYAIDPSDCIALARELAAANGYADRIEFIQALSTQVTLPEPADIIVSDLHGSMPLFQQMIPSIVDARRRFLAPGGVLIPRKDTLWVAVLEEPKIYEEFTAPWGRDVFGLDLSPARALAVNAIWGTKIKPDQMLTPPGCWEALDYTTIESPDVRGRVDCAVTRAGTGHGLVLWFDYELAPGVSYSNGPGQPAQVLKRAFLPWPEPLRLDRDDLVSVHIQADLVGGDYTWRWDSAIRDKGGNLKADFKQSTFFGAPLSPAKLQHMAANHAPTLNEDGQIDRYILELMDGKLSLGEIASRVVAKFPHRFTHYREALTRVGKLSVEYR